jgi:hypothetical protein
MLSNWHSILVMLYAQYLIRNRLHLHQRFAKAEQHAVHDGLK